MSDLPAPKTPSPGPSAGGRGGGLPNLDPSRILSKARESIVTARQSANQSPAPAKGADTATKPGLTGSVTSIAASAAQGAAGGDAVSRAIGGGVQGAIYSGVKSALSSENRGNVLKVAALAVVPLALPFIVVLGSLAMVLTVMSGTAASSSGSAISTSINAARTAGVNQAEYAQYVSLQSSTNVPWQIMGAVYQSQEQAAGCNPLGTPVPSGSPSPTSSAPECTSPTNDGYATVWQIPTDGMSGAQIKQISTDQGAAGWVANKLKAAMYGNASRAPYMTLSAGLQVDPGEGSVRSVDSSDSKAQATAKAWTEAISSIGLGGMDDTRAQSAYQTALAWYLGNSAAGCAVDNGQDDDPTATSTPSGSDSGTSSATPIPSGSGLTVPPVGTWPRRNSLNNPPLPIPADYAALYKAAAAQYGLPWSILAGIGMIETGHGRIVSISPTGAAGPMAFLPTAWAQYGVLAPGHAGKPNRLDPADAIYSAANLVSQLVQQKGSIEKALLQYGGGGADWYVGDVLYYAGQYDSGAVGTGGGIGGCDGSGGAGGIGDGSPATCGDGNSRGLPDGALVYAGTCWYGGAGVPIYANGGSVHGTHWQCTELARRFWKAKGWAPPTWSGGYGKNLWQNKTPPGAISEPQGSITQLSAGDILSMEWGNSDTGHVGVVNYIKQTGPGQWIVQMASQNTPQSMWYFTWDGHSLVCHYAGFPVTGVMHHIGTQASTPSPTATATS